jgi:predicted GNAT superfamily acetyltransferase
VDVAEPLTPQSLGFAPVEPEAPVSAQVAWRMEVRGRLVEFQRLRHLPDLLPVEEIQRETFGMSELDVIPASELVVVPETGGEVLTASLIATDGTALVIAGGFSWGGFVHGRPRLVSDFLGVRREARSLGIGTEIKRLQAALASVAGFAEIVWTVDPLRAANARLNFHKLGAFSREYERNRYGEDFAQAHYGGLPSDRLHITWPLASQRVRRRLLQPDAPLGGSVPDGARLAAIPDDIDAVLNASREDALVWRMRLRDTLEQAFADGWAVTGYLPAGTAGTTPALVLEQLPPGPDGEPDLDAARAGVVLTQGDAQ